MEKVVRKGGGVDCVGGLNFEGHIAVATSGAWWSAWVRGSGGEDEPWTLGLAMV